MGSRTTWSAAARRPSLSPWRSVPNASIARGGSVRGSTGSPAGSSATSGRSPAGAVATRPTGSAKCSPAAPRTASGLHGSASPVVSTAAASAAAATRTQAPRLPRLRGSSSRTTGASRGSASTAARSNAGRRASADDARARRVRPERGERLRRHLRRLLEAAREVGREVVGEPLEQVDVGRHQLLERGPEAQRVLDRVEALEDHAGLVAAGRAEAVADALRLHMPPGGLEPPTQRLKAACVTDYATGAGGYPQRDSNSPYERERLAC